MSPLPLDIIHYILTYDHRFIIRDGKLIQINRIDITDNKYAGLWGSKQGVMNTCRKDFDEENVSVYLPITAIKFYYFQYSNNELRLRKMEFFDEEETSIDEYVYSMVPPRELENHLV